MKIYLTLIITSIFIFHNKVQSQFAPIGAIWHYNVQDIFPPHQNFFGTCQSVGDTIISSIACKRIVQQNMNCMESGDFVYDSGGVVYRYIDSLQGFTVLYDFNAIAGGGWYIISSFFNDSTFVTIDSVSLININGQWRRILYGGTYDNGRSIDFFGPFVEGIGSFMALFPTIGVCDGGLGGLRCYEDTIIGLYDTHRAPSCDSVYIINKVDEISQRKGFSIFPNPATNIVIIRNISSNETSSLEIINVLGVVVYSEKMFGRNEFKVDVNFARGIYFVRVNDVVRKLVVK